MALEMKDVMFIAVRVILNFHPHFHLVFVLLTAIYYNCWHTICSGIFCTGL